MSAIDGWFDVCRTGTWTDAKNRTVTLSESTFDKLVSEYATADPAPICIGHPKHDAPAYAWVAKLRRVGDRLQAKLRDIEPQFRQAVEAGRYAGRSIAVTKGGVLRHIAFLGGRQPAVQGLSPSQFSTAAEHELTFAMGDYGTMQHEQVSAREIELAARVRELEKGKTDAQVAELLRKHREAGRVTPGEMPMLTEFCARLADNGLEVTFAEYEGAEERSESALDLFDRFLSNIPARIHFGELAGGSYPGDPNTAPGDSVSTVLAGMENDAAEARKLMAEANARGEPMSPQQALEKVEKGKRKNV